MSQFLKLEQHVKWGDRTGESPSYRPKAPNSISSKYHGENYKPWKTNDWNLQITHLERKMIFQTSMIMLHLNLQGCGRPNEWWLIIPRIVHCTSVTQVLSANNDVSKHKKTVGR